MRGIGLRGREFFERLMISFSVSLVLLVVGYWIYGRYTEKVFGIDPERQTPAYSRMDKVDYVPLPGWRVFLIQFLNIAGLGPIFGAIMGAKFGASAYLWIVLGCVFAGAVHDYLSGMMSLRSGGISYPEIIGQYMGKPFMQVVRVFTPIMMILVGTVFVAGPAGLLVSLTKETLGFLGADYFRVLRCGDAVADRSGDRAAVSAVCGGAPVYGVRDSVQFVLAYACLAGSDGRADEYASGGGNDAVVSDAVRDDCLRGDFGVSCDAIADDGTLYDE